MNGILLMNLPVGTRFFVNNGAWYGRIVEQDGVKCGFVEYTEAHHPLVEDKCKNLDIDIVNDEGHHIVLKELCHMCGGSGKDQDAVNAASYQDRCTNCAGAGYEPEFDDEYEEEYLL